MAGCKHLISVSYYWTNHINPEEAVAILSAQEVLPMNKSVDVCVLSSLWLVYIKGTSGISQHSSCPQVAQSRLS